MASKLSVYNGALLVLGERKLNALTERCASRRRLDTVWDGGGVRYCLEQGLWNHAMDSQEITFSPSVSPAFGYAYAFDKPENWRRTALVSDDESFCNKLVDYVDEGAYLYAHSDTLYVKFVSSANNFGLDLSLWPESFTAYVEHYFAWKITKATTGSDSETDANEAKAKRKLNLARATDAMNETPRFPPPGTWSRSRRGSGSRSDRGSRGRLTG